MESTNSAESNPSLATKHQQRKSSKNVRAPLSCGPCRARKLKCNREEPCQNCAVRKEPHACVYAGSRRGKTGSTSAVRSVPVQSMQERIDRLESLVQSLASQGQTVTEPRTQGVNGKLRQNGIKSTDSGTSRGNFDNIQHGLGLMKVDENHSQYRGNTHWGDVFRELTELKTIWSSAQQDSEDIDLNASFAGVDGPSLLCGLVKPVSFEELLATLPPKPALDRLLQRFFNVNGPMTPTFHIIHEEAFMRQYENHLANPNKTKIMWLALLFAILTMVMLSYHVIEDEPPEYEGVAEPLFELYRLRTAQCLKLGDITKCAPHTLEALIYYTFAEQATRNDNGTVVWMLFGIINRVTLQMGYHRDPAKYPEISIFQGEMRRRVWYFVLRMDDMISFQAGLPSTLRTIQADTMDPLNIYDEELYEEMTQLPPTRPRTEKTPTSYLFGKGSMLKVLGDIANFLGSLDGFSYSKVHELDEDLTRAHSDLAPHIQMSALENTENMGSSLYGQIIQLDILYNQGICVLHRKFSAKGRCDPKFAPSRTRCLQSALKLLSLQVLLFEDARKPDGTISFAQHWYRLSFTSQDFIMAAIILCIDLRHRKLEDGVKGTASVTADIEEEPILAALSGACQIWNESKESSAEAWKVHRVFSQMLRMLGLSECHPQLPEKANPNATDPLLPQAGLDPMELTSDPAFDLNQIDWTLWNSFIEGGSFDDAYVSMTTPPSMF